MHTWSKNDAAKVDGKVYRVLSVTREGCPTVRIRNDQVMADKPDSWEHVGKYTWTWNPLTPGDPFWKFVPAGV